MDLRQQVCELQALTPEQGHITRFWSQGTQKNQTLQADTLAPGKVSNGQQQLLLCAGAAFSRALGSCLHDAEQANRASKSRVRDMSLSAPTKAKFSIACNLLSTRLTLLSHRLRKQLACNAKKGCFGSARMRSVGCKHVGHEQGLPSCRRCLLQAVDCSRKLKATSLLDPVIGHASHMHSLKITQQSPARQDSGLPAAQNVRRNCRIKSTWRSVCTRVSSTPKVVRAPCSTAAGTLPRPGC